MKNDTERYSQEAGTQESPDRPTPMKTERRRWNRPISVVLCMLTALTVGLLFTGYCRSDLSAPAPTFLLLDRNGRFLAQAGDSEDNGYGYWPVDQMPPRVVAATLSLEDRRFYSHPGVDPKAILRALIQNISNSRRISGASTIAMQVARMQRPGPRTYLKKAIEASTALFMTLRHGREAVLRHYLRLVPYGNRIHGIAYAARCYLDKPVEDLSWAEIAFLSAIPQAPGRMNPFNELGREKAVRRGIRILEYLLDNGVIEKEVYLLAASQIHHMVIPEKNRRPSGVLHAVCLLEKELTENPSFPVPKHKYRVTTSLDLDIQEKSDLIGRRAIRELGYAGASHLAAIVVKRDTMEVMSWLGSPSYFSIDAGAVDYCRTTRSPGSALKPFIYSLALEKSVITPATILDDLKRSAGAYENADKTYLGPMLPRIALANSRNIPAINLLKETGLDETFFFLRELGIHNSRMPATHFGLCTAIGCLPTTLEKLVRAYGVLANDGLLSELNWFKSDQTGSARRLLSREITRQITLFLSDPMARLPAFPRMGTTEYPFPVALKTGTSQGYRDAWTIAWSRDYLVGVWVGRADSRPMNRLGGAGSAAPVAKDILLSLHSPDKRNTAALSFPKPQGYIPVEISTLNGKRAGESPILKITEYFAPGQLPGNSSGIIELAVDSRNGMLAGSWTPVEHVDVRTYPEIPARYHEWAMANGITIPPDRYSPLDMPKNMAPYASHVMASAVNYRLKGEIPVSLSIDTPENELSILISPEVPESMNQLTLRVTTEPVIPQVLWMVDGKAYQLAEFPYTVRWPLERGQHRFQVQVPFGEEKSEVVSVTVE